MPIGYMKIAYCLQSKYIDTLLNNATLKVLEINLYIKFVYKCTGMYLVILLIQLVNISAVSCTINDRSISVYNDSAHR
jgi:hypothetical protein